jgi:hypothetical protein
VAEQDKGRCAPASCSAADRALLMTYRRIWDRLPSATREQTLSAMKCWSPAEYDLVMEDARRQNARAEARRDNPNV